MVFLPSSPLFLPAYKAKVIILLKRKFSIKCGILGYFSPYFISRGKTGDAIPLSDYYAPERNILRNKGGEQEGETDITSLGWMLAQGHLFTGLCMMPPEWNMVRKALEA